MLQCEMKITGTQDEMALLLSGHRKPASPDSETWPASDSEELRATKDELRRLDQMLSDIAAASLYWPGRLTLVEHIQEIADKVADKPEADAGQPIGPTSTLQLEDSVIVTYPNGNQEQGVVSEFPANGLIGVRFINGSSSQLTGAWVTPSGVSLAPAQTEAAPEEPPKRKRRTKAKIEAEKAQPDAAFSTVTAEWETLPAPPRVAGSRVTVLTGDGGVIMEGVIDAFQVDGTATVALDDGRLADVNPNGLRGIKPGAVEQVEQAVANPEQPTAEHSYSVGDRVVLEWGEEATVTDFHVTDNKYRVQIDKPDFGSSGAYVVGPHQITPVAAPEPEEVPKPDEVNINPIAPPEVRAAQRAIAEWEKLPNAAFTIGEQVTALLETGEVAEATIEKHFDGSTRYQLETTTGPVVLQAARIRGVVKNLEPVVDQVSDRRVTADERDKFRAWCKENGHSADLVIATLKGKFQGRSTAELTPAEIESLKIELNDLPF